MKSGDRSLNILLGVTGSVAAIRTPRLLNAINPLGTIKLIATPAADHFLQRLDEPISPTTPILRDADEWSTWNSLGDPVLHIELRKWADALVIAPVSADFLAKLSMGFAENLLLSVCRAWDFAKPMILAPAMNTVMWEHPATQPQLSRLRSWGITIVPPTSKELACGDIGVGAMASPLEIVAALQRRCGP